MISSDWSLINDALKAFCRENKIERDRASVVQAAHLLLSMWREGFHDPGELLRVARTRWEESLLKGSAGDHDETIITPYGETSCDFG